MAQESHAHDSIDAPTRELLQRFGWDTESFEALRARLRAGAAESDNHIRGRVAPPEAGDIITLPAPGSAARKALEARGREALRTGLVGAVVLAGGMATRFGGVVKAGVEAVEGRTFLDLKLSDVARLAEREDARIPIYVMTSFATHDEVEHLSRALETPRAPVRCFPQYISLRLAPDGSLFHEPSDGTLSPYAPGHGDLSFALRRAGLLQDFVQKGGRLLYMSNVDNLGATLDPAVIGAHLESGKQITAEVVRKEKGDKGGAPARVDGAAQIVESFRFPDAFDQDSIPVFNTNSFVLDATTLDRDFPLTWFVVRKKVEGAEAIQFERLVGELTAFLPTSFLEVERHGADGRFQPVKDPPELEHRRAEITALLRARGVL
ncbi:UTP--glucose-1-phosphate uridylyltransferase [Sandaracinus amylolyticus]|uniref:UTP--glucose-1-phosphate uridylyltransferase n=1 Tax=Sandaracinus amylolyticus TaxID=927083 RepID=UPI001F30480C|nr:UTP--glucose-1-phosphate uridylyltransferase [Sandaracinus amylolyticus]UJR80679.1 N-acetylglucosamine-1-phosphate uridyltransferase eukaryotic [Sandaracinus amylolyticus]